LLAIRRWRLREVQGRRVEGGRVERWSRFLKVERGRRDGVEEAGQGQLRSSQSIIISQSPKSATDHSVPIQHVVAYQSISYTAPVSL
jgi:hypothetical protein